MTKFVLVNERLKTDFEIKNHLPFGCYYAGIFDNVSEALSLINNMNDSDKSDYIIERWENGEFVELIVRGSWFLD